MTSEPNLPRPETRSPAQSGPPSEAQSPPQNGTIPLAGNVPQFHAEPTSLAETPATFDLRRLRPGDILAGIASFLILISLFIPWYSFAAAAAQAGAQATPAQQQLVLAICNDQPAVCSSDVPPQFSVTALGAGAGGWRFLILVVAIMAMLYVLSRTLEPVARAFPYHWQALIGITAFQGLLVLIAFAANPLGILDSLGSSSWAFGAFLALIAAIAAGVGAALARQEYKKLHAASPV